MVHIHKPVPKPRNSYQMHQASSMPAWDDLKPLPKREYSPEVIPVYRQQPPHADKQPHRPEQSLLTTGADVATDFIPGVSKE